MIPSEVKQMRILQVSPYFHPYVGGQERYVGNLARALVNRGHVVEVLTSNFPKRKECEVIDGIQIRRFNFLWKPLNNPISPSLLSSSQVANSRIKFEEHVRESAEHLHALLRAQRLKPPGLGCKRFLFTMK